MSEAKHEVLDELLRARHSCRSFLNEPVRHSVIEQMFSIAQSAASWCNTQPWQVTVTEGRATERFREALYRHATNTLTSRGASFATDFEFPVRYTGEFAKRRREVGAQLYSSVGIQRGDESAATRQMLENFRFFGAPHVLLIHVDKDLGTYGAIDCGVYLGTLLLAAESLGIAMIPQAALASFPSLVREQFGIPENLLCVCGASFGYSDRAHAINSFRTTRAPVSESIRFVTE
jgi:nitroreductase